MAATKRYDYGQNAVNGSLAYDYDNPELFPEYEYGKPLDIPAKPPVRERVVPRDESIPRQSVSLLAITGVMAAVVLLIFALMAHVQFTQISAEAQALQSQLSVLAEENSKLTIAYESALNLTEIEDYAINTLGMQKPHSDQIHYVNSAAQDKATILTSGETAKGGDLISSLLEYFR